MYITNHLVEVLGDVELSVRGWISWIWHTNGQLVAELARVELFELRQDEGGVGSARTQHQNQVKQGVAVDWVTPSQGKRCVAEFKNGLPRRRQIHPRNHVVKLLRCHCGDQRCSHCLLSAVDRVHVHVFVDTRVES